MRDDKNNKCASLGSLRTQRTRFIERKGLGIAAVVAGLMLSACASVPRQPDVTPVNSQTASTGTDSAQAADSPTAARTAIKPRPAKSKVLAKSFDDAVARGDQAWMSGDADMAIYMYVQALSFRPTDAATLTKMGVIEQRRGELELAARAYKLAAESNPNDARVTGQLGLVYLALGEDDNARTWLARSVEISTADWRIYDGLGLVEERHGDSANALANLQHAQTLAPGMAPPILHRGQALYDAADYSAAETATRAALALEPSSEGWQLLGKIQAKRRAYSDALDSLLESMDAPTAYSLVAKTALDNRDNAVAVRYFEKASMLSPVYLPDAERNASKARERLDTSGH
jgi:Flp pilus assembly protein TadD